MRSKSDAQAARMLPDPSNELIAGLLVRYGQLLALSGESSFRVRAYERAAETIRNHSEPVGVLVRERRLTSLTGVGAVIATAVEEFVRTGIWASLSELESQVPPTLLDLLSIPGVGAKTVGRLFLEHQIVDLPALESALIAGRLRNVPGFGAKSEAKILGGIQSLKRRTGRVLLGTALPLGRRLVEEFEQLFPCARINLAGSVRRMEETVGDIDLVIADESPSAVRSTLLTWSGASEIIDDSKTSLRMKLTSGPDVDVYFSTLESFGSNLMRATGSVAHLDQLFGMPTASSEEEIYATFGLPFIAPELRQGIDEIVLAREGRLDSLVRIEDVNGEFHCHTTWSDGASSVDEMARAGRRRGYQFLGISDHSRSLGVANGLDEVRIREQRRDIDCAGSSTGIRVFAGAEVEVDRDGILDFAPDVLADLDVVIASLHSGLRLSKHRLTNRLVKVLRDRNVDIIAHPSGRLIERRDPGDFDWETAFAIAAETGTALEINADPARLDLSATLAREALASNCLLTINCDAHHPDGFRNLEYGVATARRAGATRDRILNCWPVEQIERWLSDRHRT